MSSLDSIYNFRERVNYNSSSLYNARDDDEYNKTYRTQLEKAFMIADNIQNMVGEYDTNYVAISTKKIDDLYEYLSANHNAFLKYLLCSVLTVNDNHNKLSNNLYFYLCCCNFALLSVDVTKNFNIMDHYTNKNVEMFIFSFLFSFNCFEYLHLIIQKYAGYNGTMANDVCEEMFKDDNNIKLLSNAFVLTFCN